MQIFKKVPWKMTLWLMSSCLRPPPLLVVCLGVGKQFCRFWIWSRTGCGCPPVRFIVFNTEYTELQRLLSGVHSIMRVKLAQAGKGGGVHTHPLTLHLPSPVKLQCTLQQSGQTHKPCFISGKNMYSVVSNTTHHLPHTYCMLISWGCWTGDNAAGHIPK